MICDRIGIGERSIHKARKTYATKLIDGNVPESVIKTQMGHTDIRTTLDHYYLITRQRVKCRNILQKHYQCKR